MENAVIQVEDLGKLYQLGNRSNFTVSLREALVDLASRGGRKIGFLDDAYSDNSDAKSIWALRNVCLEVKSGEALGIVGRNGAGKSTLLKILSRITRPTTGYARLRGRVGSLLEVGTGFHSELTGGENIFLNGSILGMSRTQIKTRFDEIVSFAEMDKFIDTPIKRYSSGMYMRLAFSVAAHLDTEILLVDEVLAVGDVLFQKRCLGKMEEAVKSGRTVLFVSHNMAAIESMCSRCILIENGSVAMDGSPSSVVGYYLSKSGIGSPGPVDLSKSSGRRAGSVVCLQSINLVYEPNSGSHIHFLPVGGDLTINVEFKVEFPVVNPIIGIVIRNRLGIAVLDLSNKYSGILLSEVPIQSGTIRCRLKSLPLAEGTYFIDLWFSNPYQDFDMIEQSIAFDVVAVGDLFGSGLIPKPELSIIYWPAEWYFENR